jgi:hypothetical protein
MGSGSLDSRSSWLVLGRRSLGVLGSTVWGAGLTGGGVNDPAHSAKKMLLTPNLNISQIAYSVGFQSLTEFNRLFRRVVGKAPTRFRGHLAPESAAE